MENGKYVYMDAQGNRFTHALSYEELMKDDAALAAVGAEHGYQFEAYYIYPQGTVTIAPAGSNGMNVMYMPFAETSPMITFDIPEDADTGYGIIDQYTRVVLNANDRSELPVGSILYLDADGNVIAVRTPNGLVRFYEQDSYLGADNAIYSEANSTQAHLTKGAKFLVHQAATGVYMAPHSTKDYNSEIGPNSMYFHSDYFAQADNTLVKLNLGEAETFDDTFLNKLNLAYPTTDNSVKSRFDGASVSAVTDNTGKVYMYVLEKGDDTMVLLPDGTWYASDGKAGVLKSTETIQVEVYENPTEIEMSETLQGESITIVFGGSQTTLNDDEDHRDSDGDGKTDSGYANVITNNLVIRATDNGNIFEAGDPMVVKPFSGTETAIQILGSTDTALAYAGTAHIQTLADADVKLHATEIAQNGTVNLDVSKGDATFESVKVDQGGALNAVIQDSGNVTMGADNGNSDTHDFVVDGTVTVTTQNGGSLNLTDAAVNGSLNATSNGDGSITVKDTDVTTGINLKTNGDGDITVNELDVADKANATITTNGEGDITIRNSTVSGNATISNNKDLAGKATGNGSGNVEMNNVTIDGNADVTTGEGNMSLADANISGTASITSGGDGRIKVENTDVTGTATITNNGEGSVDMDKIDIDATGNLTVSTNKGSVDMDTITVEKNGDETGTLTVSTGEGNVTIGTADDSDNTYDIVLEGNADITTGQGDISLLNASVSGTTSITSSGDGAITMQDVDITSNGTLTMTNDGVGAVDMDDVNIGGTVVISTVQGNADMDTITVAKDGKLDFDTGSGDVSMGENGTESDNTVTVSGTADITSGIGKIEMNKVVVNQDGTLTIATGEKGGNDNDVIVDDVYVDGLMTITTSGNPAESSEPGSDLLVKDGGSKLVLGEHFQETKNEDGKEMFFDIGGNIGTPGCYFKVSYEGEAEKPSLTLNIHNANDIFLTQLTDIATEIENGENTGRLEGDSVQTEHDECISNLGTEDVQVLIPEQTPEQLAKQLAENLGAEELQQLIDGRLSGTAVRDILGLSEERIAEVLTGMTSEQVESLWGAVIGDGSKPDPEKLTDAVLGMLNADDSLTGKEIDALLPLSDKENAMEAVLVSVIGGEKIRADENGNPIQATDENDEPLYLDKDGNLTTECTDAEGKPNDPVYETEALLDDKELFEKYWESLTDEQKQDLLEAAYDALEYPSVKDQTKAPRDLVLNIGKSTGESYLLNVGDITINQGSGTFTAGEVVSTHGDVSITAPSIEGVAAKAEITDEYVQGTYKDKHVGETTENGETVYGTAANVYAGNHSYGATVGGIGAKTELTTDQRSWKEDVIANIDADATDSRNISRNDDGEIVMNFNASFNGVRDIDLTTETTLNASAIDDIAITELTGNQKVDDVTSSNGSVTLKNPDGDQIVNTVSAGKDATLNAGGDMKIQHVTAGGSADLTAGGSILDNREANDTEVNVKADSGSMTSENGSIGADADHRIGVSITDHLTTDSSGDTNLNAMGNLNLTADTDKGIVHVDGDGNLTIDNTKGDLNLGAIEAEGDVTITAEGGLILGDKLDRDAQVKGDNISITAKNGNVGTEEAPLLVDTTPDENGEPGVLNAEANNGSVFITEITGDMTIGSITSTGEENSVNLKTEDGSIVESDKDSNDTIKDAVDAAIEAAKVQAKAEALEDQRKVLEDYVNTLDGVKQELKDARDNRDEAKTELDQAKAGEADAKQKLEDAKAELEALKKAENPDLDAIQAQQAEVDKAQSDYDAAKADTQNKQDVLDASEKQLQDAVDSAGDKTYGVVPGLADADTIEEVLDALEQEKQTRDKELNDLTDALDQAVKDAEAKQREADEKAQNVSSTGITADGDVNLEVNSSTGSASIGDKDNALGITAGGTTSVSTGEGTVLENVDIESGGDLTIGSLVVEGEVNITSKGDIKGSPEQDSVDITAPSANLGSLNGDIGTEDDPLKTTLDRVTAFGDNVYLDNTKDLIIDSIIADGEPGEGGGHVDLTVDGDVIDGDNAVDPDVPAGPDAPAKPDDTDIIGGDVTINASGDIGTKEDPLEVESDELSATGDNINISSEGDVKIDKIVGSDVDISSGGKVTDKGDEDAIISDNLSIDAGAVGEKGNPLNVNVSGKLDIQARYGYINLANSYRAPGGMAESGLKYRTLIHKPTGIRVSGYISRDAELFVTDDCEHENCIVCKYLAKLPAPIVLGRYYITMTGHYYGMLYVQIPVDETYEGQTVTIAYCDKGRLMTIQVTVKDGFASFYVDKLYTFVVLDGKYHAVTEGGHQMLASDETREVVYADGLLNA